MGFTSGAPFWPRALKICCIWRVGSFSSVTIQEGESLKRAPKGYDPDHPLIEDLKRKDFVAGKAMTEADACAPDFIDRFAEVCRVGAPFAEFLTKAVGLPW